MSIDNIIGKRITKLRKRNKITTKQLGEELKIKEKIITKWENGTLLPNVYQLKELADFFNISIDKLIDENQEEEEKKKKKKKIITIIAIILIQIIFILITIRITDDHYKWTIKNYDVNSNFIIKGYSYQNTMESKIIINKIEYNDTKNEIKSDYFKIMIYKDNKEICTKEENFKEKNTLNNLLTNYTFTCEYKGNISKDKLTIKIEYNDKEDKKYLWVSDLKEIKE